MKSKNKSEFIINYTYTESTETAELIQNLTLPTNAEMLIQSINKSQSIK